MPGMCRHLASARGRTRESRWHREPRISKPVLESEDGSRAGFFSPLPDPGPHLRAARQTAWAQEKARKGEQSESTVKNATTATEASEKDPYRVYLREDQIPTQYYNLRADMPEPPEPMRLPDGTVAAFGRHEELYEACPEYRRMVDLQRLEEEGGAHHA